MPVGLLLKFENAPRESYDEVMELLGIDPKRSKGNWPPGLLSHTAGHTADGTLVVMDVWESEAALDHFIHDRLGAALQKAAIDAIPQLTRIEIASYHTTPTSP
jgi:quinol monooxygenase YgiN